MKTGAPAYARRLLSSPGRKDGLYWEAPAGQPGELVEPPEVRRRHGLASRDLDPDHLAAIELDDGVHLVSLRRAEVIELGLLLVPGDLLGQLHDHEVLEHGPAHGLGRQACRGEAEQSRGQAGVGESGIEQRRPQRGR